MASRTVDIHTFALTGSGATQPVRDSALQVLKPHLPVSLPIYRRLQFGRFFDASVVISNLDLDVSDGQHGSSNSTEENGQREGDGQEEEPWLLAFVDRSCRPETEVWLFASWDASTTTPSKEAQERIDALLIRLLHAIKDLGLPTSIHQDVLDAETHAGADTTDHAGLSRNDYGGHASDPNIVLWGSIHERTVPMLDRLGVLSRRFKTALVANHTFVWDVDVLVRTRTQSIHEGQGGLPKGLRWGELTREHFGRVRARTQIPRQDRTLAVLPNIGVFPDEDDADGKAVQPIAWAFVGLDASLTTLHVEPEWRGRGLAKAVTTKLFQEKMAAFWEEGVPRLTHGFVLMGNKESEGMCRSLGGVSEWEVYWLRVDLSAVG